MSIETMLVIFAFYSCIVVSFILGALAELQNCAKPFIGFLFISHIIAGVISFCFIYNA